ncbi:MAG: class I SAM-dependent methyltransferase [Victivallales bacterium]|nr:class I SAM-dependent methyltransferase [Victivallales bacterium]
MKQPGDDLKSYAEHFGSRGLRELSPKLIEGFDAWYSAILPEDKKAAIFDFGCGRGEFLAYLKLRGYSNAHGGDINPDLARAASEATGLDLVGIPDVEGFVAEHTGEYDLLHLKDVVEHVPKHELVGMLETLRGVLKPGGMLVVSAPQMCGFSSLYTRYDDFTHTTLFTSGSLEFVIKSAGYQAPSLVRPRHKFPFSPSTLLFRLLRRLWFVVVRIIYFLERPGERMPEILGDRIMMTAVKPRE